MRVFKHRLLQHFMLSLFCKLPVQPMTRIKDMRTAFMVSRPSSCFLASTTILTSWHWPYLCDGL